MKESLNSIWNNHRVELLNYIKTKVSDDYAAEDILQEVFIKIYKNIDQLENPHSLKPWLYRITNNTIIDFYRKSNPLIYSDEIGYQSVIEERPVNINQEVATCLKSFLYKLPDKYREPLELFEFNGMKHKEIAKKLNLSLSGSKTRILRAKERLKELLIECCQFETDSYGNILDYRQKKNSK
ncbi:MAG: RNA polymerase sigma factor SigZ [Pelosinus sp.]|nr:RNA polymerase sigma factor SigZ [Pelosinus sp.]